MIQGGEVSNSKVGAGRSIVKRHERFYRRGTLLFIEGECSTEMFIIKSGCVRILKQEGENTVELARLGPGSVLGELSLLDRQPRGATAQVVEDTTVTVIDEELFSRTLQSIPEWLCRLIRVVVKRLRDTMKKTSDDIVLKSIGGVIQIILLLTHEKGTSEASNDEVLVSTVKDQVYAIMGLGAMELENVFLHLILKDLILIRKNPQGQEYILVKDRTALRLYMQYLRIHQRGGTLIGETFDQNVFELIDVLLSVATEKGSITPEKLMEVEQSQVEIELQHRGLGRFVDRDALETLSDAKLLSLRQETTVSKHGHHEKRVYIFNPDILRNVLALKTWLPVFREEIRF